jgi:acetyl-CoA/propionyl-CoA carboxylase, biotin carboxylase, biotin carboxyl carrier protein
MSDELSPREAAERLGTTTRSVQRWIASGRLPARRVGGRWRVANDAIVAFGEVSDRDAQERPAPAIRTLFVANRGEIAARIRRTCDRLGIRAVVPDTDGPDALDLLDGPALVAAAVRAAADAVHPGFGFLAENAAFAELVAAAGLRWVGPPPSAIRVMGDKAAARRLATSLGVPTLPGYDGDDQSDAALAAAAEAIGYPVLIKPAAGGGGKGMREVREADRLLDSLAAARREATAAFGDDRLILERLVEGGRHVEIQVLFDARGNGVHLGDRDCSIQRRHQKVLEETPSPVVDAALRARLGAAALSLARAVGYVSAGTCEFLVDDRLEPAFLEMNTRLQVEHPVTELVTGRDLVADQMRIAAGESLGFDQSAADRRTGHAVEVRLYAEDAEDGFLPATGRIEALRWPAGEGIRVDAGVELGSVVSGRFDPMLAKIIAWGPERPAAFERLARALDGTVVLGLVTNLRFLRWLARQPVVVAGEARTDTLDRTWPPDDWAARTTIPDEAWSVAAAALSEQSERSDPWAGGWRLNARPVVTLETDGVRRRVPIAPNPTDTAASGFSPRLVGEAVYLDLAGRSTTFRLARPPDVDTAARAAATHAAAGSTGPAEVLAPMPGSVLRVHVGPDAEVAAGDPVVTLEAMKMEHVVAAPIQGRVGEIRVRPADQVTRGELLAVIEP